MPQAKKGGEKKAPRQAARPRLDAVLRHIKAGSYDDDMSLLRGAIEDRLRVRQEAVLGLVKEAFGDNYSVVPVSVSRIGAPKASLADQTDSHPEAREWEEAARQAEIEEQARKDALGDDDLPEGDPDYESRSPIIGSVPEPQPKAEPEEPRPNPFPQLG